MDLIAPPPRRCRKPFAMDALIYKPLVVVLAAIPTNRVNRRFDVFGIFLRRNKHKKGAREFAIRKDRIAACAGRIFLPHYVHPS